MCNIDSYQLVVSDIRLIILFTRLNGPEINCKTLQTRKMFVTFHSALYVK